MRNGTARLMPVNGIPRYMTNPNAASVARTEDMTPKRPRSGFDFTQSVIMQVRMQKAIMIPMLREKYGTTDLERGKGSYRLGTGLMALVMSKTKAKLHGLSQVL
jgi:hypothetical protein